MAFASTACSSALSLPFAMSRNLQRGSYGWLTKVWGLGFGGLGFRVWGLGFRVWGLGFTVWGLGFGVYGLGFRVTFYHVTIVMVGLR